MSATHPLARAAARAGRQTDVVLAAQAQAVAIDARILALAPLTSTGDASRTEIKATLAELGRVTGAHSGGEFAAYWSWERNCLASIRVAAERCGFSTESWVADVRGPAWRS